MLDVPNPVKWPEIEPTVEWRAQMVAARKRAPLTQEQLASKLGVTQNAISKLEGGETKASTLVLRICIELRIPPPSTFFGDELIQRWMVAGYALRAVSAELLETQIAASEKIAALMRNK